MSRRFGAAVFTAVVLHAALICFAVLPRRSEPRRLDTNVNVRASEVEVSMFVDDDGSSREQGEQTPSGAEPLDSSGAEPARGTQPRRIAAQHDAAPDATAEIDAVSTPEGDAAIAELGAGTEENGDADAPGAARPRVNLGLDGSIMRQATLAARDRPPSAQRAPRRRPVVLVSHWSEGPVRAIAQKSAPPDGQALLTLEWDSNGQLLSVRSSAASSHSDEWQRLAQGLSSQLAARANGGAQNRGLRVVYLVKTDLVLPESKRSLLPSAKYASAEQLKEGNLPPGSALMFGVRADDSPASKRVVSVQLLRSDAL